MPQPPRIFVSGNSDPAEPGGTDPIGRISWPRLLLGIGLAALALWLVSRNVEMPALLAALRTVNWFYGLLALGAVILTLVAKAWRWQLLYFPDRRPGLLSLFWSMMLGQFINLISPLRLGELMRIITLPQAEVGGKARSLGTIVVEKTLDSLMLAVLVAAIVPFVVVPRFVSDLLPSVVLAALLIAVAVYLIAYQTERIARLASWFTAKMPALLGQRLDRLIVAGLGGLSALRSRRHTLKLVLLTGGIAILGILPSWFLFKAFALPYGLIEASLIHAVLSVSMTPSSTPAKIGVFEYVTGLLLRRFGLADDSLALGYALFFHVVVIAPQLLFGILAAVRLDWRSGELWRGQRVRLHDSPL